MESLVAGRFGFVEGRVYGNQGNRIDYEEMINYVLKLLLSKALKTGVA